MPLFFLIFFRNPVENPVTTVCKSPTIRPCLVGFEYRTKPIQKENTRSKKMKFYLHFA